MALLFGPGHVVVHGNPAFLAEFGEDTIGLPASEALLSLPGVAFDVVQRVYVRGTPLACWIDVSGERRRLTAAPRRDPETNDVDGVGSVRAREIREGLRRLQEQNLVDRYLNL